MTPKSVSTSRSSRLLVGSSMMTSRLLMLTARAMATICCTATLWCIRAREGSTCTSKRASSARASAFMRFQSRKGPRRGSRPRKMFSATERNPTRLTSW